MKSEQITYVALLRGINVGGHTVKMDVLRELFSELGYANVRSFIQSGNVFFETDEKDTKKLRNTIETHLEKALGFAVPACLRTLEEIEEMWQKNPFQTHTLTPDTRFSVNFLAEPTTVSLPLPYLTADGGYEVIAQTPTELFVIWHLKNGRPGNSYGVLEKMVKQPSTTRFWHTLEKMLTAAKG